MYDIKDYRITCYYSFDDKCWLASIPELGGCIADGETPEEAIINVRKLAAEWMDIAKDNDWEIPEPAAAVSPEDEQPYRIDSTK